MTIAKALTTYVLNDLKVQVNGNLLREYTFSYNQGGPQTITDSYSGQPESVAGYLTLTKIAQLGTQGTALNAPTTTMSYIEQPQHYLDIWTGHDALPVPGTNCGPSWTPQDSAVTGLPCFRWEQSYNSYYLSSLDNGIGWHANFTCDGKQTRTNLCGSADDRNWSRVLLTKRVEQTNGVSSTWSYQYYLQGLTDKPCGNCVWGTTWGNQNDADTADYYNGQFTSYASAQVTNPDGSSQVDDFASTPGWGLATSGITCYESSCNVAPYWNEDPGAAGNLKTEEDFDAKNQKVSYHYDTTVASGGYGQWLLSTTDANGQTTTYTYDVLGRLTSIIEPGDTQNLPTTSYTYTNTCGVGTTTPCLELDTTMRVTSGSATITTTRQWFDGMGRLVETQSPGPNEFSKVPAIGSLLVTYTLYDSMVRATTTSLPYAIANRATGYGTPDLTQARTVTSYDSLGRATSSVSYGLGSMILSESTIR